MKSRTSKLKEQRDNGIFILIGISHLNNQFFESLLRSTIKFKQIGKNDRHDRDLDDLSLGSLIKRFERITPQISSNNEVIKKLWRFNKKRVSFTHKYFVMRRQPENFDSYLEGLANDNKFLEELKEMGRLSLECADLLRSADQKKIDE